MGPRFLMYAALVTVFGMVFLPWSSAQDVAGGPNPDTISVSGVVFEKTLEVQGRVLKLAGAGLLRYRVVFKGYVAALYLGAGSTPGRVFEDIPKRLEIEYFHAISARDFQDATREGLEKNLSGAQISRMGPGIQKLLAAYLPVKPEDRYAFTYVPGKGSTLTLNGRPLGEFQGLDFANAFLSIWIGPNPVSGELKRQLLGGP